MDVVDDDFLHMEESFIGDFLGDFNFCVVVAVFLDDLLDRILCDEDVGVTWKNN